MNHNLTLTIEPSTMSLPPPHLLIMNHLPGGSIVTVVGVVVSMGVVIVSMVVVISGIIVVVGSAVIRS